MRAIFKVSLLLAAVSPGVVACSSAPSSSAKDDRVSSGDHKIVAFVKKASGLERIEFGGRPAEDSALSTRDISISVGDPIVTRRLPATDLIPLALRACGAAQQGVTANRCLTGMRLEGKPWTPATLGQEIFNDNPGCSNVSKGDAPFLYFPRAPETCDQVAETSEMLVCAAQKLADIAKAEKPVEVKLGDGSWLHMESGAATITVAPPTPQDRFLLRDQALELLSYLELLEGKRTTIAGTTYTCGELYGQSVQHPEWTLADKTAANLALYKANKATLEASDVEARYPAAPGGTTDPGPSRLEFYTGIIRAAGSLSQELVNDAVYADLGGAEQRAAGMSPQERAATLWRPTDEPYNSMAHLARVLYGRQATIGYRSDSPGTPAPRPPVSCASDASGWVTPERVWQWAPIPALRNRGLDAPALSGRQLRAARAVRGSRILPDVNTPVATLRTSMRSALVQDMATDSGLSVAQVEATDFGAAISTYVDSFGDAELGVGAMRARVALGLATNRDATTPVSLLAAGKTGPAIGGLAQLAVPAVAPIGDPAAYMAAVGTGASCTGSFPGFADDMRGLTSDWGSSLDGRTEGGRTQDIFAVGQGLRGVMLRMLAASAGTAASAETKAAQQGTLNELESWAGGQRFALLPTATGVEVHAYDVDFGALDIAETADAIRASFVLARGSSNDIAVARARCAAWEPIARGAPIGLRLPRNSSLKMRQKRRETSESHTGRSPSLLRTIPPAMMAHFLSSRSQVTWSPELRQNAPSLVASPTTAFQEWGTFSTPSASERPSFTAPSGSGLRVVFLGSTPIWRPSAEVPPIRTIIAFLASPGTLLFRSKMS